MGRGSARGNPALYEPFHDSLCTHEVLGTDGRIYTEVDEDWKIQIQMRPWKRYIKKWRELI